MLEKNYRFDPTDQELVEYLYLKVKGSKTKRLHLPPLVNSLIKERDVYSREPWNLQYCDEFPLRMKETEMYFFSRRTPSSTSDTTQCVNAKRVVGSFGKWHCNGKKVAVTALTRSGREVTIGSKTFLSFVRKDNAKCHWVMDEYCLHSKNREFQHNALCRIREIKKPEEKQEKRISAIKEPPFSNKRSRSEASASSSHQQEGEGIAAMEEEPFSNKRICMEEVLLHPLAIDIYQSPDQIDQFYGYPQAPMSLVPMHQQYPSPMSSYRPPDSVLPARFGSYGEQPTFLPIPLRHGTECYNVCMSSNLSIFGSSEFCADREHSTQLPSHVIRQRLRQLAEATTTHQ